VYGVQAVATETVEAVEAAVKNGNGKPLENGNGNGNSSSNGGSNGYGNGSVQVVVPAAISTPYGANGNGNGSPIGSNGNGSSAAATAAAATVVAAAAVTSAAAAAATVSSSASSKEAEHMRMLNTIDEEQNAEAAGQLELAAATRRARSERSAAGTPYKAPGGNWSKFKTYSVWQVGCASACPLLVWLSRGIHNMPPCLPM